MDFGLHLPLMDFGGNPFTLDHLIAYTETGQELGFSALAANDHLVYSLRTYGLGDHSVLGYRARSGSAR